MLNLVGQVKEAVGFESWLAVVPGRIDLACYRRCKQNQVNKHQTGEIKSDNGQDHDKVIPQ